MKPLTLISLLLLLLFNATAQSTFCPPNIDFESGTIAKWQLDTGTCCPINTTLSGPVVNRHTITSGPALDPYGGFPVVAPGNGLYSLKIGNSINGAQAERARYYVKVPNGSGKQMLIYRYAVVFENPNHDSADQPRFEVKAYDSATNTIIACNEHIYVSSANLPDFYLSSLGSSVYYRPWTSAAIDLTGSGGKTIAIDFAVGDCKLKGHFGYGYVDVNCGIFRVDAKHCNGSGLLTLKGPPGFARYTWMDSSLTTVIDTTQLVDIPIPQLTTTYVLITQAYAGLGCSDTFWATYDITTDNIAANASPDTTICYNGKAKLKVNTTNANGPFKYKWWPATGLSCTDCATPFASPPIDQTYKVYIENYYGCRDTDEVVVTIQPRPVGIALRDTSVCGPSTVLLSGMGGASYKWFPSFNVLNPIAANTQANVTMNTVYRLEIKDSIGCTDTEQVAITVKSVPVANAGNDVVICLGEEINLIGSGTGAYSWWPAAGISDTTIANPKLDTAVGTFYYRFLVNNNGCSDTDTVKIVVNPLPIADAGNDTTLCAGLQLQLNGSGGNSYAWMPATGLSNPNIFNPSLTTNTLAHYMLAVTNSFGCKDTDDVVITVNPKPIANAGKDTTVCKGTVIKLNGSGGGQYFWSPAVPLSNPSIPDPVLYVNAPATYQLVVTNTYGCQDSAIVNIAVESLPVANAGPDTIVCIRELVQLHGSGGGSYKWSPAAGMSGATTATPTLVALADKTYSLVVTTPLGCSDTDEVKVSTYPLPIADAGPDTGACFNNYVQLKGSGGGDYLWYPTANMSNELTDSPIVRVTSNSVYYLTVSDHNGCRDTDRINIQLFPNPIATAGNDSTVCPGASVRLNAKGGMAYQWYPEVGLSDPKSQSPHLIVHGPCEYFVIVENQHGCSDTDVVAFNIIPFIPEKGPDQEICLHDTVQLNASGGHAYVWNNIESTEIAQSSSPFVWPRSTTVYSVTIQDTLCKREEIMDVNVIVDPLPVLTVIATEKDCGKNSGMLVASGAAKYMWEPADYLGDPNAGTTTANPPVTTRYFLTAIDEHGCQDTTSALIKVYNGEGRLFLPDAFTPNGDGKNDCYRAIIPGDITKFNLRIFNRFGEMVFEADDIYDCWDGNYKGQPAELATYFYYYSATSSICGEIYKQGDMHLIR